MPLVILSKILSYFFALVVILTTGDVIFSLIDVQEKISTGDMILILFLLMLMLMGIYYIFNDIWMMFSKKKNLKSVNEEVILDEDLIP